MIHDLHAFCFQAAPSVWFWELWHGGSCEWNSDNVAADVTDTADDAGGVWKSAPGSRCHMVSKNAWQKQFRKKLPIVSASLWTARRLRHDSCIHLGARWR